MAYIFRLMFIVLTIGLQTSAYAELAKVMSFRIVHNNIEYPRSTSRSGACSAFLAAAGNTFRPGNWTGFSIHRKGDDPECAFFRTGFAEGKSVGGDFGSHQHSLPYMIDFVCPGNSSQSGVSCACSAGYEEVYGQCKPKTDSACLDKKGKEGYFDSVGSSPSQMCDMGCLAVRGGGGSGAGVDVCYVDASGQKWCGSNYSYTGGSCSSSSSDGSGGTNGAGSGGTNGGAGSGSGSGSGTGPGTGTGSGTGGTGSGDGSGDGSGPSGTGTGGTGGTGTGSTGSGSTGTGGTGGTGTGSGSGTGSVGDGSTDPDPDSGTGTGTGTGPGPGTGPGTGTGTGTGEDGEDGEDGGGGGGGGKGFAGSCISGFTCKGDAIQCAIAREQHIRNCKLFDTESDESKLYEKDKDKKGNQTKDLEGNKEEDISSKIKTSSAIGGGSCIANKQFTVMGVSFTIPFNEVCPYLRAAGDALVAVAFLIAMRILTRT